VQITLTNGGTSYSSIAANQATYLGSVYIDSTAGQTSAYLTTGQSRKNGLWNAYNRVKMGLFVVEPTAAWSYNSSTWRCSNGDTTNVANAFTGLAEETFEVTFNQFTQQSDTVYNGIGINSTTTPTGKYGHGYNGGIDITAKTIAPPALGITSFYALEKGSGSTGFKGQDDNYLFSVLYAG
jgi:hypothetical protein